MNILAILDRELRAESRNARTYWLRVLGASGLVLSAGLSWLAGEVRLGQGGQCFAVMHQVLFWAIWLVVPVMTADCLSREKREGTLGLLFLTPLRAHDIVLAKGCAHGLRAATLVLAAAPVLVLPFLMGGVSWAKVLSSMFLLFSAACGALGAGLLASSSSHGLTRSIVLSAFWAGLFLVLLGVLCGFGTSLALRSNPGLMSGPYGMGISFPKISGGLSSYVGFPYTLDLLLRWTSPGFHQAWGLITAGLAVFSLLFLQLLLVAASSNLRRRWQQPPRLPMQTEVERQFCEPRFGVKIYRGWMHRLLDRNPIGWLERRTWQGRVVSWTWLAVIISLASVALSNPEDYRRFFHHWQSFMASLLAISLALSAAGSFRREREAGVMELLLVTPLRVEQILVGRLRGLWAQLLPAVLLLLGLWIYVLKIYTGPQDALVLVDEVRHILLFMGGMLAVPVIGLYFSLRCRLLIMAVSATIVTGILLPRVLADVALRLVLGSPGNAPSWMSWLLGSLLGVAAIGLFLLKSDYRRLAVTGALGWLVVLLLVSLVLLPTREAQVGLGLRGGDQLRASLEVGILVNLFQVALAGALGVLLHRNLVRRKFSLPQ